ncbi:MAG: hypothetical protein ACRCYQ_14650 [Nocardioides sp.]
MIRFATVRALACVLTTAVLMTVGGLAAGPAGAERYTKRDRAGDAMKVDVDQDLALSPAPGQKHSDVVRTTIDHRGTQMVADVRMRNLRKIGATRGIELIVLVETNKKNFTVQAKRYGAKKAKVTVFKGQAKRRCKAARITISAKRDLVRVSVPRVCLGKPRWVKVGVGVIGAETAKGVFFDDALRKRADLAAFRTTPKLRRG